MSTAGGPGGLRTHATFVRFWAASTVSDFGTYVTSVALAVLVLVTLGGSAQDKEWVSAARWAPYLLFGLVAGIWVDRFSRRSALMVADLGRAVLLGVLCFGGVFGWLSIPVDIALIFAFGALSLVGDAAYLSFIPRWYPGRCWWRGSASWSPMLRTGRQESITPGAQDEVPTRSPLQSHAGYTLTCSVRADGMSARLRLSAESSSKMHRIPAQMRAAVSVSYSWRRSQESLRTKAMKMSGSKERMPPWTSEATTFSDQ